MGRTLSSNLRVILQARRIEQRAGALHVHADCDAREQAHDEPRKPDVGHRGIGVEADRPIAPSRLVTLDGVLLRLHDVAPESVTTAGSQGRHSGASCSGHVQPWGQIRAVAEGYREKTR